MYKKTKLKNGARVIKVQNKNTETATVMALFKVGSRDEKKGTEGIAHFLEHMFFKGTEKRQTATEISKELDAVGASHNAFTGKEYTGFWAKTGKKDFVLALDVISDMLLNSKFDSKEIDVERDPILEEINMYEDAPMRNISSIFENTLYTEHGLGHDQLGSSENVRSFSRKNLLNFYKKYYTAENLVIVISGNFNEKKTDEKIEELFAPFERAEKENVRTKVVEKQKAPEIFLKYKKTDQTNFSLGFRAFETGNEDEYVLDVLNVILGGNSSSRLYENVREKEGLAYYIYSYTCDYQDAGYFAIQSGVGNDKCEKAIEILLKEIRRIKTEKVSEDEIRRAKSYIKGRMDIGLESSSAVADFVAIQEISTGKILTPEEKFDKINSVTTEDLERVARKIFINEKLNLAIIGPFRDKKKFEKLLKI
ncbi:MAG: pitrilysin family protein [Candidatus Paceibacterota bacterium]